MFVIFLTFADKPKAPPLMEDHKSWIKRGFENDLFVAAGSLASGQGGVILAPNAERKHLEDFIRTDPFVQHGVVTPEIIEISLSRTDPRLDFLSALNQSG